MSCLLWPHLFCAPPPHHYRWPLHQAPTSGTRKIISLESMTNDLIAINADAASVARCIQVIISELVFYSWLWLTASRHAIMKHRQDTWPTLGARHANLPYVINYSIWEEGEAAFVKFVNKTVKWGASRFIKSWVSSKQWWTISKSVTCRQITLWETGMLRKRLLFFRGKVWF